MIKNLLLSIGIVAVLLSPATSSAQIIRSPADTGRIFWGHTDFSHYDQPGMCDRAVQEILRSYTRYYTPDTSVVEVVDSIAEVRAIPDEAKEVGGRCLSRFRMDEVLPDQLWPYIRLAATLGDTVKVREGIEVLFERALDSALKENVLYAAFQTFFSMAPRRMDIAQEYLNWLDSFSASPVASSYVARQSLINYWYSRHNEDSVKRYSDDAIELLHRMNSENREKVNIMTPFTTKIDMANYHGDLEMQQIFLDSMVNYFGDWRQGRASVVGAQLQSAIDFRKSVYNRKANPIDVGLWFNHSGIKRPAPGGLSLMVLTNHISCGTGIPCPEQYSAIKTLGNTFKDSLHITLITNSMGYVHGSYVLTPEEEGEEVVKFFTNVYDMPFTVLLDPRPVSKLPDGRLIRGVGPVAEMFSEWRGSNAILTDREGRIQWMGNLLRKSDLRPVSETIKRLIQKND